MKTNATETGYAIYEGEILIEKKTDFARVGKRRSTRELTANRLRHREVANLRIKQIAAGDGSRAEKIIEQTKKI